MNILICDDIHDEAQKLEKAVKKAGFEAHIRYFEKGPDLLDYLQTSSGAASSGVAIDVCFLDIVMPEMDGIELARNMRAAGFNGRIVFLTTSNDYGSESYQVKAYSYLVKPVTAEDIAQLLNEIKNGTTAENTMQTRQHAGIKVVTRNMARFVYFHEISFVEVINKNVYFRLLDGDEIVITSSLSEILPQLMADGRFAQCHRSYVVNMDVITNIHGKEIALPCGRKVPVSRNYKEFSNLYFKHGMGSDL